MARERGAGDLHAGKERQRAEDGVQRVMVRDVDDAVVRAGAGDAPRTAPGAGALPGAGLVAAEIGVLRKLVEEMYRQEGIAFGV
jgi:hypothetical protein